MPTRTETEQVQRATAGDRQAFTELVNRYRDAVYGICYHRVGHPEEAKDLAQEAFLRAYLDLGQLPRPGRLSRLAAARDRRVCSTWQRRQRLQMVPLEGTPEPIVVATWTCPWRSAGADAAERGCPAGDHGLHINGYSVGEVARFLEVPVGAWKSTSATPEGDYKER